MEKLIVGHILGIYVCGRKKKMIITPSVNLVENIGFGKEATHTDGINQNFSYKVSELQNHMIYLKILKLMRAADNFVFNHHFRGKKLFMYL